MYKEIGVPGLPGISESNTSIVALTDFSIRIQTCSANNTSFSCNFDIVLVKD